MNPHTGKINSPAVQARAGASLKAQEPKSQIAQATREPLTVFLLFNPAAGKGAHPDMDEAVKKSPRRYYHCLCCYLFTAGSFYSFNSIIFNN